MTEERQTDIDQAIASMLSKVRELPPGGDLMQLIDDHVGKIATRLTQAAIEEREKHSAQPGAFSPCAEVRKVRQDEPVSQGESGASCGAD